VSEGQDTAGAAFGPGAAAFERDPASLERGAAFECRASPSLALLKYWGKSDGRLNLPATPSLALSLGALTTSTRVEASFEGEDEVSVGGLRQHPGRYAAFFDALRRALGAELRFRARSRNDFPTSSGLASSSSAFAALALAGARAGEAFLGKGRRQVLRRGRNRGDGLSLAEISAIARIGSVSAARAVFGGFSFLPARSRAARPIYGEDHWPELRVLVACVSLEAKALSSREAMERSRSTSPFYESWVRGASAEVAAALEALERRDLESLGESVRKSYLRMFGAMLACDPPIFYWLPGSIAIIRECEEMRRQGIGVWETMDAGPQVKMLCLAPDVPGATERIRALGASMSIIESRVGPAPLVSVAAPAVDIGEGPDGVTGKIE
jgi:diphosphomevalonate decarboxylase